MTHLSRIQALLGTQVQPWVDRLPWQPTHPLRFNESEGYDGRGVMGARSGPAECIDFDSLAHEMAHAIEIGECGRMQSLERRGWGLHITSQVKVGGQVFEEPRTMQASAREAEVCGIQWRIMEMVGHPDMEGFAAGKATMLARWMPDWVHGGSTPQERLAVRERLIREAYLHWPAARVQAGWMRVQPHLERLAQLAMDHEPAPRRRASLR